MVDYGLYILTDDFMSSYYPSYFPQNKGDKRPFFMAFEDRKYPDIVWMIPISSKTDKYDDIVKRYPNAGKKIEINRRDSYVLTQNLFPALKTHVLREYTVNSIHYKILNEDVKGEINKKCLAIMALYSQGKIPHADDVLQLYSRLINEIQGKVV